MLLPPFSLQSDRRRYSLDKANTVSAHVYDNSFVQSLQKPIILGFAARILDFAPYS
jgi:hypothetical protein